MNLKAKLEKLREHPLVQVLEIILETRAHWH